MTTIAYKDGVIAADTAACMGEVMLGGARIKKIARNRHGDLAGAAGDAIYGASFLRWFEDGEAGAPPEGKSDDHNIDRAFIVRTTGTIVVFELAGSYLIEAPVFAIGSGKAEALGAMLAGADAERAVLIAAVLDPHTGDVVDVRRRAG